MISLDFIPLFPSLGFRENEKTPENRVYGTGSLEQESMEQRSMEQGSMEQGSMEQGSGVYGILDRGLWNRGLWNRGQGSMEQGSRATRFGSEDILTCLEDYIGPLS